MESEVDQSDKGRDNLFGASNLVAFSTESNIVSIYEVETGLEHLTFSGPQLQYSPGETTHVKEIPGTTLLISLNHKCFKTANFGIYDVSKKGRVKNVYTFDEAWGHEVGHGDIAYNAKRGLLAIIPQLRKVSYHLFQIQNSGEKTEILLLRKAKWNAQSNDEIVDFSMNQEGARIATLDWRGLCFIYDVDTHQCLADIKVEDRGGFASKCKWSPIAGDGNIFVMRYNCKLNILNVEKQTLVHKQSIRIAKEESKEEELFGLDVCETDGNLLALAGNRQEIRIFDVRISKTAKSFGGNKDAGEFNCIRWSSCGTFLTTAGKEGVADVYDFRTEQVLSSFKPKNQTGALNSVCFL